MRRVLIYLVGKYVNAVSYLSKSYAARIALSLFTKPKKGRITRIQGEFLDTAFKEELKYVDYHIMTYRWLGKKQTVLLAHGWESNAARWQPLILNLKAKGFNIVALDAPAHGNSGSGYFDTFLYSEFINVVVKRFNVEIIVGHSVGGMASVMSQHNHKLAHVKKLILIGSPSEYKGILERYTNMLGYNQRIKVQLNSIIIERSGQDPSSISTAKYLKNMNFQGLIIHDEEDDVIPYDEALLIKNSSENVSFKSTKGLNHSYQNEEVTDYITKFIEI